MDKSICFLSCVSILFHPAGQADLIDYLLVCKDEVSLLRSSWRERERAQQVSEEDEGDFATKFTNMLQKVAKSFSIHAGKKMRWFWIGSEAISRLTCMFSTAVHSTWQKPPLATTAPRLDRGPPSSSTSLVYSSSSSRERPNMAARGRQKCCRRAPKAKKGQQRPTKANTGAPSTKSPIISILQGYHDQL